MVGLGQGARIGNCAGDGIEKHIQLGRSKRKLYVWGRAPGLGTLLRMELKRRFKNKIVGLGQSAQIGNLAEDGIEKQI